MGDYTVRTGVTPTARPVLRYTFTTGLRVNVLPRPMEGDTHEDPAY